MYNQSFFPSVPNTKLIFRHNIYLNINSYFVTVNSDFNWTNGIKKGVAFN